MEILLAVLIVAIVVWFVSGRFAAPRNRRQRLRSGSRTPGSPTSRRRKEAKYREIRDTELDREQGKLSEEDWTRQDAELRREAVEILKELDEAKADAGRGVPAER